MSKNSLQKVHANFAKNLGRQILGNTFPSEKLLKKKRRPQPYPGGESAGNVLEASNALSYTAWGFPAVLLSELSGKALVNLELSGISSGKTSEQWKRMEEVQRHTSLANGGSSE